MANKDSNALSRLLGILALSPLDLADIVGADKAHVEAWLNGEPVPAKLAGYLEAVSPRLDLLERMHEELATADTLIDALNAEIARLASFKTEDVLVFRRAFEHVPDRNAQTAEDYGVLRRQAWGRIIRVRDLETNAERCFRVAWGARGWQHLAIYSRNAPIIRQLMTARAGDVVEVNVPNGSREYEVLEVSILARHEDSRIHDHYKDFAELRFALDPANVARAQAFDLQASFRGEQRRARDELIDQEAFEEERVEETPEALRLESRSALGDAFFMTPLEEQEQIMTWPPTGHVLVEGVAGSGKTSVALGRAAMLCLERTDVGEAGQFTPDSGVGFVLAEHLVDYLHGVKSRRLGLERMPVESFFNLRQRLIGERRLITQGVRRTGPERGNDDGVLGTSAWVEAMESAMPAHVSRALAGAIARDPRTLVRAGTRINSDLWANFDPRWQGLQQALAVAIGARLEGSLERVDRARGEFADMLEKLNWWDTPRYREDRRRIAEHLRDAVSTAYAWAQRYFETVNDPRFAADLLRREVGFPTEEVRAALDRARGRAAAGLLSNEDIDAILLLAHRAAVGYRGRGEAAKPIEHLRETAFRNHVFIDEVQDFTEVQVRLMAAQANPRHRCVTAVGDFAQRLAPHGIRASDSAGINASSEQRVFLGRNMRQTAALHALSRDFRVEIQGDARACEGRPPRPDDERPFVLGRGEETPLRLSSAIRCTRERAPHFSIAVLCPSERRATELESELHEELWERNIPSRISLNPAQLCEAYYVHFTTPQKVKGLEYDAVFVVDLDDYRMDDEIDRAAAYVALSRACRRLGVAFRRHAPAGPFGDVLARHLAEALPFQG